MFLWKKIFNVRCLCLRLIYTVNKERNHMYTTISIVCPLISRLELAGITLILIDLDLEVLYSFVKIGVMLIIDDDESLTR